MAIAFGEAEGDAAAPAACIFTPLLEAPPFAFEAEAAAGFLKSVGTAEAGDKETLAECARVVVTAVAVVTVVEAEAAAAAAAASSFFRFSASRKSSNQGCFRASRAAVRASAVAME